MSALPAWYFDGRRSARQAVSLLLSAGRLKLIGADVDLEFDMRAVRLSARVADTPRWLYLPGGGACVTADNAAMDRYAMESRLERTVHNWESRPAYAALAVLLVAVTVWLLVDRGVPAVADSIARRIPPAAEATLGAQTLAGLDRYAMHPTKLEPQWQSELRAGFERMARTDAEAAGDSGPAPVRLEFRSSPLVGPNAFALPSGIIVVTDELAFLAQDEDEIYAVLAHELGHVRHRHAIRGLLQASATGLIIAGLTGDVASATALAAAAPTVLLQNKFSRDNEREADEFAFALMLKNGISPHHFAAILERMEKKAGGRSATIPAFLSSHPPTPEREAMALRYRARDADGGGEGK